VILALATGMKQAEIMNFRWSEVDFERNKITLYETKNGEIQVSPLTGHAHSVLKSLFEMRSLETELVFSRSKRNKPMDLRFPWEQAIKKAYKDWFTLG
jgi:integrase